MAAFRRGSLFIPPLMQCRHRGKINIGRPQPGPIERRVFEAITKPIVLDQLEDPIKFCSRIDRINQEALKDEISQYERIYIRDVENIFNTHKMIAVCQVLSMSKREEKSFKNLLINKGLRLKFMSNSHVNTVVKDSKFVNILPLVKGKNYYIVSEEPMVKEMLDALKKIPKLILLGGIVEDRLLTREGFMKVSQLPPMDMLLGETCSLLGSHAAKTHSLLSSHQRSLSSNLQQYIRDQTEGTSES